MHSNTIVTENEDIPQNISLPNNPYHPHFGLESKRSLRLVFMLFCQLLRSIHIRLTFSLDLKTWRKLELIKRRSFALFIKERKDLEAISTRLKKIQHSRRLGQSYGCGCASFLHLTSNSCQWKHVFYTSKKVGRALEVNK